MDDIANPNLITSKSKWATVNTDTLIFSPNSFNEQYLDIINRVNFIFREIAESNSSVMRTATLSIPYSLLIRFPKLTQFRHYKWVYLAQDADINFTFDKMAMPPESQILEKEFVKNCEKIQRTLFILNKNSISDLVDDICYFFHEKLISKKEASQLKSELLGLVNFIENLAKTGTYETGTEVECYLSDVHIDSFYSHLEGKNNQYALNIAYFVDTFVYQNSRICQKQKKWIESLKRVSVHITKTGERQRFEFFNKQREIIENSLLGEV